MKPYRGPPMTLGVAAAAGVRLIVWCEKCEHQVEPHPAEMATRYGAETSVLDWRERLVCFRCGGRRVDMVVTGTKRRRDQPRSAWTGRCAVVSLAAVRWCTGEFGANVPQRSYARRQRVAIVFDGAVEETEERLGTI